jgi:single-strand DNA-binding protein
MSRGLNKAMIIGRVGRDPELRYSPTGRPVVSFSVATVRDWTDANGERREETEWFNVVAWGHLAETCKQRLCRDQEVYVEGRLQTRGWEGEGGEKCFRMELVAQEMIVLGERPSTDSTEDPSLEGTPGDAVSL